MELSKTEVLSVKEIEMIDDASKEILQETGIKVLSTDVLEIFKRGGCDVNFDNLTVKIPIKVIESCLKSFPAEFKLYSRDKESYLNFGKNLGYCASGHNAIYMFNEDTFERRLITKNEVANFAKIADALENISVVGIQAMPQDIMPQASILHALDAVLRNTSKHIFFSPENVEETLSLIKMIQIVSEDINLGVQPIAICQLSPISPLTWSKGTSEALVEICKSGIPLCLLPQPYSGVTSPITLAGTLTQHNAEILSGIVLSQLVNEGCAVIYGAAWTTFEMQKGAVLIGTPERCILSVAGAQMAKYYNIPSHCISFDTDSNLYDEQNGFEKIFNTIANLQAGINLLVNAGMFSTGFTVSYSQLVVDNEIAGFVYRYLQGINVNKDTIAKEVIKKVGPHNNFIMEEHTLNYLKSNEHCHYRVSNRDVYENWKIKGKPSIMNNAKKIAEEILKDHKPKPLSTVKLQKLNDIINEFEFKFL